MKRIFLRVMLALALGLAAQTASAAETSTAKSELEALVEKVNAKLSEKKGDVSKEDLAPFLKDFIKAKGMAWTQYFDGKGWQSKLAGIYGINSIPATYLLDGEGKIIAKGESLRGNGLEETLGKYLK